MSESSFMNLPPEIREGIIEHVLFAKRSPPDMFSAEQNRLDSMKGFYKWNEKRGYISPSWGPENIKFERTDYVSNSLPLLLVNRQVSIETRAAVERHAQEPSYSLDVIFVDERELWPTWLCVPALLTQIDNVNVKIRIADSRRGHLGSWGGSGGPPVVIWAFYFLLENFLRRGPLNPEAPVEDKQVCIKNLTLDVVYEGDPDLLDHVAPGHDWDWMQHRRSDASAQERIIRPEWLASFIRGHISGLLYMGYHTAEYGGFLHERIGNIRLCAQGEPVKEFDVGAVLATLSYNRPEYTFGHVYPHEKCLPRFWQWKADAIQKRKEFGLQFLQRTRMTEPEEFRLRKVRMTIDWHLL